MCGRTRKVTRSSAKVVSVRSLFLHSDNLIEGAANRARRWLETEGGGGDDLTSGAPVAGVFAVATGDIFAVEQVVDVDADRRSRQAKRARSYFTVASISA